MHLSMVSTYPPTACGLATFSSALERALVDQGHLVDIVSIDDGMLELPAARRVAGSLHHGSTSSTRRAAHILARGDVAIIQHEYGIYSGPDGEDVLALVSAIDAPVLVVLHTVLEHPSAHQAQVLIDLCEAADRIVVMTHTARARLVDRYPIDESKVATIPHGALVGPMGRAPLPGKAHTDLLSWGLLGPGKGIERVIDAVAELKDRGRSARYTIAGMTHPKVVAREGERYRSGLIDRARQGGVDHLVRHDQAYRGPERLTRYIAQSPIVVMAYESQDQVVSGVLVDSIAAGRPVIATDFPHARELLSTGAGIIVPHDDPDALRDAIEAALWDETLLSNMTFAARSLAPLHGWDAVAEAYAQQCAMLQVDQEAVSA